MQAWSLFCWSGAPEIMLPQLPAVTMLYSREQKQDLGWGPRCCAAHVCLLSMWRRMQCTPLEQCLQASSQAGDWVPAMGRSIPHNPTENPHPHGSNPSRHHMQLPTQPLASTTAQPHPPLGPPFYHPIHSSHPIQVLKHDPQPLHARGPLAACIKKVSCSWCSAPFSLMPPS